MLLSVAASILLSFCSPTLAQWTVGQAVNTTSGLVTGKASKGYPEVSEYLGIRFGETTAGQNRFMPPKRYYGKGPVSATKFGAACPQASLSAGEDCLFINVWTKPQKGEKRKAVLLWIVGGAFVIGEGGYSITDGAAFAQNQDVIIVSFNYRVNLFGFPGVPGEHANPGLLDQRLAAEWTRDNIEAFGGDPNRITIFGESAGGVSVDTYALAWKDDPIAHAFIAESGTALTSDLIKPKDKRTNAWYRMTKAIGCGGSEKGLATIECAQGKTLAQISSGSMTSGGGAAQDGGGIGPIPPFRPAVDEKTVFSNIEERTMNGLFAKKPLLVGTNLNESTMFESIMAFSGGGTPQFRKAMESQFRCAAKISADGRAKANVPVYRYIFANNKPGSTQGATHGDEVFHLFGDGKTGWSEMFQTLWAKFAKDPVNGLESVPWPKYSPTGKTIARIGHDQQRKVDLVDPKDYDYICK